MIIPAQPVSTAPRAITIATLLAWLALLLSALAVLTGASAAFDWSALLALRTADGGPPGPHWLTPAIAGVTLLGAVAVRIAVWIGAGLILLRLSRTREAVRLSLTFLSGWLLVALVKASVARPRPPVDLHLSPAHGFSFPSGHSFSAAMIFLSLALTFAPLVSQPRLRRILVPAAVLVSAAVAASRIWLGVHWASDALTGWLAGLAWALTSALLFARFSAPGSLHRAAAPRP
ncbi:phosphatase PAP2 family protein [Novosphingobium sp. 1949]|uniref:Phosphatase PAP2 family protein n=1 Tax=Novosphingobium organovorum TaxID=2930092 RepID=A0ABT0BC55_9SPHN|nr:phosphatase PAP2 family protein [Novosphingobium organovorum]MCJ2182623.1 phosphatase PAP2 family protein [Novosphingobium organovorum]